MVSIALSQFSWSSFPGPLPLAARVGEARSRTLPASGEGRGVALLSDVNGLQRREAVEGDGGVGRRIRPGAHDQHLVADLQADREVVRLLLVEHVGRVTG